MVARSLEPKSRPETPLGRHPLSLDRPPPPEPNLILITAYKDLASVDRPLAEAEKSTVAQFGSLDAAHELAMKREAMRTRMDSTLLEALEFTK
jgi:hypothetical protein